MSTMFRHPQNTPGRGYQDFNHQRMPKVPERPITPYVRYSRKMWPKVRADNPDIQIWEIGNKIGQLWAALPEVDRSAYQHEYDMEKAEYDKQVKNFSNQHPTGYAQFMTSKGRAKANEKNTRSRMDVGGVVIQPIDEEDLVNDQTTRKLAASRYDRNHKLISELFSTTVVTDTRTIVIQPRMEMLKKQAASLTLHQTKLDEELAKLESTHAERKRLIEKNSDDFQEQLKKVVEEKPNVGEAQLEEKVKEWEGKLLEAYAEYKKKQEEMNEKIATETAKAPVLRDLVLGEDAKETETKEEPAKNGADGNAGDESAAMEEDTPKESGGKAE